MVEIIGENSLPITDNPDLLIVPCPRGAYNLAESRESGDLMSLGDKLVGSIPVKINLSAEKLAENSEGPFLDIDTSKRWLLTVKGVNGRVLHSTILIKPEVVVNIPVPAMFLAVKVEVTHV